MESFYRFELYYCREPQGIGFIVGLRDIGIPETMIDNLIEAFDKHLPIPNYEGFSYDSSSEYPASYFTEKGRTLFYPTIKQIIDYVDSLGNEWEVVEEAKEANSFLYEDELQVVILKNY